jgi:hypothetical protein
MKPGRVGLHGNGKRQCRPHYWVLLYGRAVLKIAKE